jgi:hypothetical protein
MATGTRNFIHQKVRVSRLGSRKASFSVLEDVTCFRGRRYSPRNLTESMLRRTTPRPSDAAFSHLQHQGRKLRCHLGSMGESEKIASRFDRIRAGPALSATDRSPPSLVCLCSPTWTSLRSPAFLLRPSRGRGFNNSEDSSSFTRRRPQNLQVVWYDSLRLKRSKNP